MRLLLETDVLNIEAADFWFSKNTKAFLNTQCKHFNNKRCDLPLYEVDEERNEVTLVIRTQPNTYIPALVKRALGLKKGQSLELYDELRFNKKSELQGRLFEADLVNTNNITKASKVEGTIRCQAYGQKTCILSVDLTIEVKLAGVGRLVEGIIAKEVRAMYEGMQELVDKYVRERKERAMELSHRGGGRTSALDLMESEKNAERDAVEIRKHVADVPSSSPGSPSSTNNKHSEEVISLTNDDFDFMSVNSDLTDIFVLEQRWQNLAAFETEATKDDQDLTGFGNDNKCCSCFSSCFPSKKLLANKKMYYAAMP